MLSISLQFDKPYLLFLLIAFYAFTLLPYFKINKKYRNTRNRITSMVLHFIVSTLAVLLISGTIFVKGKNNPNNELIILVDVSDTEDQVKEDRNKFVKNLITQCSFNNVKVGIITFGFDQELISLPTDEYDGLYSKFVNADLPDTTATNIASAITYSKDFFEHPESGKIVLVTDGKETDENAKTVIKSTVATGLTIDTVYVPSSFEGYETEIINVEFPEYHVNKGEEFSVTLNLISNYEHEATIQLIDNDTLSQTGQIDVSLVEGEQSVSFKHMFVGDGLHEISFKILNETDNVRENNTYVSYMYVESFNKILILEHNDGESNLLKAALTSNNDFDVTILNINKDTIPETALELCAYDEVILNNISNKDMDESFFEILNEYVYTYGGGLFTTGGNEPGDDNTAHSYNRSDMVGSLYQKMLPVQVINYTPPVGVIFIIDRSGSMGESTQDGETLLGWAKQGVHSCLSSLTERDYIGIMSLETEYGIILELTPRTQEAKIRSAIDKIDTADGSTTFTGAIERAGQALRAMTNVDRKHIIIVTDGYCTEGSVVQYEKVAKELYETDGITISVVGVSMSTPADAQYYIEEEDITKVPTTTGYYSMLRLTKIAHGRLHAIEGNQSSQLVPEMREDLKADDIKEVTLEPFFPTVVNSTDSIFTGIERLNDEEHGNTMSVELEGFYGTKVKDGATLLLTGDYNVPLYAQWKYGNGMVGSFMCDVYGLYSGDFMSDQNGINFLKNVVKNLTPVTNIRDNDIKLTLYENNYSNQLSILTTINEGEYLEGTISYEDDTIGTVTVSLNNLIANATKDFIRNSDVYVLTALTKENNYSRCKFTVKKVGTYTITINKYNQDGELIGTNTLYKSLAFSDEYNVYEEEETDPRDLLNAITKNGKGILVTDLGDSASIIDSFETIVYKKFDPRYLFSIIIIISFLLDVAVRKFKFKWPHEIIEKYRKNKMEGTKK